MNATKTQNQTPCRVGVYRPSLRLYHPNPRGTGSALEMKLHPAHDDTDGSIMLRIANQNAVGDRSTPTPTFPRFDWERAICVKLDFFDLGKMLQVFRGECESIDEDRGLFHRTSHAMTKINLRHLLEPAPSYSLDIFRTPSGGESVHAHIVFTQSEASALCEAISMSMAIVGFGIPMLVPRDTTAYRADQRRFIDAQAS